MISIIFLGTGGGAPSKYRKLPAVFVRVEGVGILLDAGEGVQERLSEASISPMDIDVLAISHMHGDHVLGVTGLLETMGLLGRKKELVIIGPRTIQDFIESSSSGTFFKPQFDIRFQSSLETKEFSITPFPTCHTIESQGYIIRTRDKIKIDINKAKELGISDWNLFRKIKTGYHADISPSTVEYITYKIKGISIAYTGDTRYCSEVLQNVKGVNLLIHDSTFLDEETAAEFGHSTSRDAAKAALNASVGMLALIHISSRYHDTTPLLTEAKRIFPRTILPEDLSKLVFK
ncbi:ribonuclease Z [Sulfolobales archaeon HS-7]|nr:ribonuclease Z [Sulfolobales archaeon HS-7]